MQWLQDPNQSNVDTLNKLRLGASRRFRNKRKEYMKTKIDAHENNSKIKNIRDLLRGINDLKKVYQPITNTKQNKMGDMVTNFHSILARWRNHYSQLFNVCTWG
jgi:hypothetical protein